MYILYKYYFVFTKYYVIYYYLLNFDALDGYNTYFQSILLYQI